MVIKLWGPLKFTLNWLIPPCGYKTVNLTDYSNNFILMHRNQSKLKQIQLLAQRLNLNKHFSINFKRLDILFKEFFFGI